MNRGQRETGKVVWRRRDYLGDILFANTKNLQLQILVLISQKLQLVSGSLEQTVRVCFRDRKCAWRWGRG